jgi:hypothetical protein
MKPDILAEDHYDFVVILPWNISEEVQKQTAKFLQPSTRFVTAIPSLKLN